MHQVHLVWIAAWFFSCSFYFILRNGCIKSIWILGLFMPCRCIQSILVYHDSRLLYLMNCRCFDSLTAYSLLVAYIKLHEPMLEGCSLIYSLFVPCTILLIIVYCDLSIHRAHVRLDCSLSTRAMHHNYWYLYLDNCMYNESILDLVVAYSLLVSWTATLVNCIYCELSIRPKVEPMLPVQRVHIEYFKLLSSRTHATLVNC